jgi:hypothetical protein
VLHVWHAIAGAGVSVPQLEQCIEGLSDDGAGIIPQRPAR